MKTEAYGHQLRALDALDGKRNFALLMEQGTGKTWTTIADVERCYELDKIDGLLVVAPNGVHTNWTRREFPTHASLPIVAYTWKGRPTTKKAIERAEKFLNYASNDDSRPKLTVMSINVESLNTEAGAEMVTRYLQSRRVMFVLDESTRIKNHKAKRSIKACELGKFAIARRILSGTPLTRSPADLYMQFHFLKPGLLGTKSFAAFNAQYSVLLEADDPGMIAIMKKMAGKIRGIPQIVKKDENGNPMFRNLERLANLIAPHSFRVRKEDCLDLPPKVYKVIPFDLTPAQRKIYDTVREEYAYVIDRAGFEEDVSFEAIAARTKLKQVTSGFINIYGDIDLLAPGNNPRMSAFKDLMDTLREEDEYRQIIVWATFKEEMKQLKDACDAMGLISAEYHGGTPKGEREQIIDDFQAGKIQVFIGHPQAAGIGLTLTAADVSIYYSCNEDNELRMQSEDRNHRIGTTKSVTYFDLVGVDTIDEAIQQNLAMKTSMAQIVIDRNF